MPETARGLWYPESKAAADVPADMEKLAKGVDALLGEIDLDQIDVPGGEGDDGKLPIVANGLLKLLALSGDVTINEEGKVQLGKGVVGTEEIADKSLTTSKYNDESITLGKLAKALGLTEGYFADGAVTGNKVGETARAEAGLNSTSQKRNGKSIIATEESVSSASYTTLGTADQVAGIVLPTDGLIFVTYAATWKSSVSAAGRAALFLDAENVKMAHEGKGAPVIQQAQNAGTGFQFLGTSAVGLRGSAEERGTSQVTTGQILGMETAAGDLFGGPTVLFAKAGTYTVSIRFKSATGSVTAKERALRVWTKAFG